MNVLMTGADGFVCALVARLLQQAHRHQLAGLTEAAGCGLRRCPGCQRSAPQGGHASPTRGWWLAPLPSPCTCLASICDRHWHFGELLAHLAYNRHLRVGMVLGSGTVSNRLAQEVGSACLAEVRALETLATGSPVTPWLCFGGRLGFEALDAQGRSVFGAIGQRFAPQEAA